jgi:hypothetical protein
MMLLIVGLAAVAVVLAILYLAVTGDLSANLVIATSIGVFFSVLVGAGLVAVSYFSNKVGHDDAVDEATRSERERERD